MSRSTETVRLTLRAYDRDHPDRAIFPAAAPSLDDDAKARSTAGSGSVFRPRCWRGSTGGPGRASIA